MKAFEAELKNKPILYKAILDVSSRLGILPEWLAAVIYNESKFSTKAKNPISGAVGLIQWMKSSLPIGITSEQMLNLDDKQQMEYVYKYFLPYKSKLKSIYDTYMCVFFPAALGKSDTWVFETSKLSASLIANQNQIFDLDKNKKITVFEFKRYIDTKMIPKIYESEILKKKQLLQ